MMFEVKLILAEKEQSEHGKQELKDNCTFVKNDVWIFEGEEYALGAKFTVLDYGIVPPLGDYSQKELVILCKQTFEFDHSLLK
jgi:hypothetical protein